MAYSTTQLGLEPYFLWNCLAPNAGGKPTGKVAEAIAASFGSFADFEARVLMQRSKAFVLAGPGW
ncbi:hypothetical protein ACNKHU_09965 [Shigella flexneri]